MPAKRYITLSAFFSEIDEIDLSIYKILAVEMYLEMEVRVENLDQKAAS